eukprot:GHVH01007379.1.p1 GENE.GHVH01007379.1~~GHVH01007379.1.p1  ORF type:complete len:283 (+),score=40.73 GHVH01007379.1:30-878(+)
MLIELSFDDLAKRSPVIMSTSEISTAGLNAIVFGSTGAVGKWVVNSALASVKWSKVTAVTRAEINDPGAVWDKPSAVEDRLFVHPFGFSDLQVPMFEEFDRLFTKDTAVDAIFYCIGTTLKDSGNAEKFQSVDYGYLNLLCRYIREKSLTIRRFDLVSAVNASSSMPAWIHPYPKTKAMCENVVIGIPEKNADNGGNDVPSRPVAQQVAIWQPPLLDRGERARPGEKVMLWLSWIVPSVTVENLGYAMVHQAEWDLGTVGQPAEPVQYFQDQDIKQHVIGNR